MAQMTSVKACIGICTALFFFGGPVPPTWSAKKTSKNVTTANGSAIRKVYIRAASPDMTSSAATELTQDTCLTTVADAKQADAVLDVGMALPGLDGGGLSAPGGFGSTTQPRTMGGNKKSKRERSFSATCSDGNESGGCTASDAAPRGGVVQPPANWPGNVGGQWDVSLALPADDSQELWEPDGRSKETWSEQLRTAAGCPVCPGEHFNRKQYTTYRQWIEAKCPEVLAAH